MIGVPVSPSGPPLGPLDRSSCWIQILEVLVLLLLDTSTLDTNINGKMGKNCRRFSVRHIMTLKAEKLD
jgi:hypothetical protein